MATTKAKKIIVLVRESETKGKKQLRVTIPPNRGIEGGDAVEVVKL